MSTPVIRAWQRITDTVYGLFVRNNSNVEKKVFDSNGDFFPRTITIDTDYTATGSEAQGQTYYDTENHTLSTVLENGVILQHGQELHVYGKNVSGAVIPNGSAVSMSPTAGQFTGFALTDATDSDSAYAFIGLATQELAVNEFGYVTRVGAVRNIATTGLTEGYRVYVDASSPGALTDELPDVPNFIVHVGVCERVHANEGRITVLPRVTDRLQDLSDVDGTPLTTTGQLVVWNQESGCFDFTDTAHLTETQGLNLSGTATVFEDLRFPLTSARATANSPEFDETNLGYLFPQNDAGEVLYIRVQFPHAWKEGSTIYPHVHWRQKADQAAVFKIDYKWYNLGDAEPAGWTTYAMDTYAKTYTSGTLSQLSYHEGGIAGTGKTISSMMLIKLYRDDNVYTGDALTDDFDIHYEIDAMGSAEEFVKE